MAMWHPGCTVTACPERIVSGVLALALGHTSLVAIEPIEYTSQVLFPRLKIFSRVSEIRNLQLVLMRFAVAKKSDPMQSWTRSVLSTVRPSQKKVWPRRLHAAKSDEDSVWNEFVSPMAIRSARPTSGTTEMLANLYFLSDVVHLPLKLVKVLLMEF